MIEQLQFQIKMLDAIIAFQLIALAVVAVLAWKTRKS